MEAFAHAYDLETAAVDKATAPRAEDLPGFCDLVDGAPPLEPDRDVRLGSTWVPLDGDGDPLGRGGGGGDGGGGDGGNGGVKGQTVWQTYLCLLPHRASYHLPVLRMPFRVPRNAKQSSPLPASLGSPLFQLKYDSGVLDGLHTHVPSEAASVPPVHTSLPLAAVSSSTFCAADCTLASCRPAA